MLHKRLCMNFPSLSVDEKDKILTKYYNSILRQVFLLILMKSVSIFIIQQPLPGRVLDLFSKRQRFDHLNGRTE